MHMYRMSGDQMDNEFRKNIGRFISCMKRVVVKAKLDEGTSLDEEENLCLLICINKCARY